MTFFLVPIAIALSFALFRWLCPLCIPDEAGPPLTDEERRVYRRWEVGVLVPFFTLVPLLGFAWYFALKGMAGLFLYETPGTRFLLQPAPIFWGIPAIFLGIISSAFPIEWLYRFLLRDRYGKYERACNERAGFDGKRVFAWLAVVVAAGSSVGILAGMTSFARFDDVGIEIRRPLRFRSQFYMYSDVKSIEHRATFSAPSGKTIERPHDVVVFGDGTSWSTREGLSAPAPGSDEPIAHLVAQKSGRAIVEKP